MYTHPRSLPTCSSHLITHCTPTCAYRASAASLPCASQECLPSTNTLHAPTERAPRACRARAKSASRALTLASHPHSINEIGRWAGSVTKDNALRPIDRLEGEFRERVRNITERYCKEGTARSVCAILNRQIASVRTLVNRVGADNLPVEGGFELFR